MQRHRIIRINPSSPTVLDRIRAYRSQDKAARLYDRAEINHEQVRDPVARDADTPSVVFPGKIIGVFCFEPLVAWAGYKNAMYVVAVMQSIGLIGETSAEAVMLTPVQLNAKTWQMFTGGRVIAYYAVGIVENVVPTYLAEISPASLRGFFAGLMNIVTVCGQLV